MKKKRTRWIVAVAVAACVALAVGMVAVWPHLKPDNTKPKVDMTMDSPTVSTMESGGTTTQGGQTIVITTTRKPAEVLTPQPIAFALAQPKYPKMAARPANYYGGNEDAYDAWWEDRRAQRMQADGHTDGMTDYYADTMAQFLAGKAGENRVYSPLNVYLALSMLAETAEGNSRQQILNLLGVSDLTALREKCSGLWNGVYLNDGAVTSVLANSLWLSDNDYWQYDMDTVNALAQHYYASTFEGVMGSEEYNKALQDWINEQTDNLLKEQASGLKFDPTTVLALASTICFKAKWEGGFYSENNQQGIFHTSLGKDVSCVYMSDWNMTTAYFGDNFTAVSLGLDDGAYEMIFFLPDKGVTVDSLITDRQVLNLMQGKTGSVDSKYLKVNMSIPKFDMVSDQDLIGGLKQLGVTDVFDAEKSDFGAILTQQTEPVWINKVQHAARVAIDEEGVTAAAYTVMIAPGSAMPKDEMDFVLDRPFMFAITGPGDTILFTGVVENP